MLLRVYSNRFLRNHTGKVVPRVLPSKYLVALSLLVYFPQNTHYDYIH